MTDGAPFWIWDPAKNAANRHIHGLSFETAALVFDDPLAVTIEDPYPYEQRWRTVGMVGTVLLMVVHTWPERDVDTGNEVGRVISARKATSRERNAYEEGAC
ncbi:MAG: BrnT family toxin [Chloroflexi bacterium]|nr:BrnT family toxin [Chloroflexota bacterium]